MGKNGKKAYLLAICKRYHEANRAEKSKILDEFCAVCGYNRKYAIRRLKATFKRLRRGEQPKAKPGPRRTYEPDEILAPLKSIWFASDQICSKHLKAAIPLWLPFFEDNHGALSDKTRQQLLDISPATIDRLLQPVRAKHQKGLSGTKPGTLLKNQIPIKTNHWDTTKPGFVEADTVALCGNSLAGEFVWCLTLTDINTTWTEIRAVWGKGAAGVLEQIKDIEANLCFELHGFDCDNGSEFLNYHLLRHFQKRNVPFTFTRSRPYKKNDNAHVEQKNWTHVRQLFGYDRYDNMAVVPLMNAMLPTTVSLLKNHFTPSTKLISKTRVNAKYKKIYDAPMTPYQRVLNSQDVKQSEKERLMEVHRTLDPFKLKQQLEAELKQISKYTQMNTKNRVKL